MDIDNKDMDMDNKEIIFFFFNYTSHTAYYFSSVIICQRTIYQNIKNICVKYTVADSNNLVLVFFETGARLFDDILVLTLNPVKLARTCFS